MMQLLVDDLWPEILRRCGLAKRRRAAIAYVNDLSSVEFQNGDVLITDASEPVIKSGGTSAEVLAELNNRGVELFSYPCLHAKVWIFDLVAIVGSANASNRSQDRLLEAGILTKDGGMVSAAQALIETLRRQGKRLTGAEIDRLLLIPVSRAPVPKEKARPLGLKFGKNTWITSGGEIEVSLATKNQQAEGRRKAREVAASPASRIDQLEFEKNAYLI